MLQLSLGRIGVSFLGMTSLYGPVTVAAADTTDAIDGAQFQQGADSLCVRAGTTVMLAGMQAFLS